MDDAIESFVINRSYAEMAVVRAGDWLGYYIAVGNYLSAKYSIDYIKNMLMKCYILNDQIWVAINEKTKSIHIGANDNLLNLTEYWFGYDDIEHIYWEFRTMFERILLGRYKKEIYEVYYKLMLYCIEKFKTSLQYKVFFHM